MGTATRHGCFSPLGRFGGCRPRALFYRALFFWYVDMIKHCPICNTDKLLSTEHWLPRKDSRDGYRGICRPCWYAQQRPNKRRHYAKNADRLRSARRRWRAENPEKARLRDLRYYLKNRERKLEYNRRYYWQNHERLTAYARWYGKAIRPMRIDMRPDMPTDRTVDMRIWQDRQERRQAQQMAAAILTLTMQALTKAERHLLMAFEHHEYNLDEAARALKISVVDAEKSMERIQNAARSAKVVITSGSARAVGDDAGVAEQCGEGV